MPGLAIKFKRVSSFANGSTFTGDDGILTHQFKKVVLCKAAVKSREVYAELNAWDKS